MIPVLISNKVQKLLNGWMSDFIWNKRKPRLKISKLQLSSSKGGLDVPCIRCYQLASQLRFIAEWVKEILPLFGWNLKSARSLCNNNPIISNTLKAWFATWKLEGRSNLTSLLIPIQGNPGFLPGMTDHGYSSWTSKGIKKMCACMCMCVFDGASLQFFEQFKKKKSNLPRHNFFNALKFEIS